MRTSADEVSIHAVSPESTFRASSACASEASASTAASASDERTHQYPAAKDRCLLSIVPPVRCEETVEQWWCHDLRQGVNREPPRARRREVGCPVSRRRLLLVQQRARRGAGA